ncbi:hypothetical protein [Streptomyces mobaraensis]|uniref:Uncharacterized protein n=1 Tax=Streptomyces mobaraensis TaxID=35621 RepID=A0A5N5W8D6_STRMB|nr:hypothetical protein [Streptomyces mobaraensis]KAB7845564.1 hypothetical protein FRZ00_13885 [Streptomyces mobaraensis]
MPAAAPIPSLLYYADSYDLVKEVATRLRLITGPRDPLPKGLWEKSRAIRRHAREAAEEEKRTERHRASFEGLMHDPAQEWARASTSFRPGSLAGFFAGAGADLPPFLAAWRDGEAAWPFAGAPFPRDFLHSTHPLLRLRALLPDWPEPGYGRDRVHLDAEEQAAAGLLLARADRYDLLEQAVAAGGRALLAPVRPAFEASLRERSVRALRTALAAERRRRDRLFRRFAAEDDPEPDERWIAIDWDAVRRAADAEGPLLREQAPEIAAHPACPMDLRVLVATRGADQFVWSRLLSDRPTGLHLLRTLPMRPDRSLAVPLSYAGETGVGVGDLLDLAHPADLLLRDAAGLPGIVRWHPMKCVITEDDERGPRRLARGITEAADRRLGDDPGAWTIGCRLVAGSRFTGSVNDLFARATAYRPRPRTGRDDDRVPMTGGA